MNNPTQIQLEAWAASHKISMTAHSDHIELIAYDPVGVWSSPISRVVKNGANPILGDYEDACNEMARNLCIVPPRIALSLNPITPE